MTFEAEMQGNNDLDEYTSLNREKSKIVTVVNQWMSRATALHTNVDAAKQTEIVTLRNAIKSELQTALGL